MMMPLQQEWFDLRKSALKRLHSHSVCSIHATQAELLQWDEIVLRFRKLREALTAAHAAPDFCCEVYELSAVICAAARNMAELLKCLQRLVNNIYPAMLKTDSTTIAAAAAAAAAAEGEAEQVEMAAAAMQSLCLQNQQKLQQQQQQGYEQQEALSVNSSRSSSSDDSSSWQAFLAQDMQQRRVEVSAALLLYFACVPRHPVKQELVKQIRQASNAVITTCPDNPQQQKQQQQQQQWRQQVLLMHPVYQSALQTALAVVNCNWVRFVQCSSSSSNSSGSSSSSTIKGFLIRVIVDTHLERLRVQTANAVAASYRMIPTQVLLRWMMISSPSLQQTTAAAAAAAAAVDEQHIALTHVSRFSNAIVPLSGAEGLSRDCLMRVLLAAAEGGSKGARVAFEQCSTMETAVLPYTLMFRHS